MEIAFEDPKVRRICEDQREAEAILAPPSVRRLRSLLAGMRAAITMADFIELTEPEMIDEVFRMPLGNGDLLIARQSHVHPPMSEGCIEWNKVYRVRILSIERGDA